MAAKTYKLTSIKGDRIIQADSDRDAIMAALEMERELQPAYGIGVKQGGRLIANVEDGKFTLEE